MGSTAVLTAFSSASSASATGTSTYGKYVFPVSKVSQGAGVPDDGAPGIALGVGSVVDPSLLIPSGSSWAVSKRAASSVAVEGEGRGADGRTDAAADVAAELLEELAHAVAVIATENMAIARTAVRKRIPSTR